MINFRLSDGHSHAIEFSAPSLAVFQMEIRHTYAEYCQSWTRPPELHVRTDVAGEWIPPNYPHSNNPIVVRRLPGRELAEEYWSQSINALLAGNYFDEDLGKIISHVTKNSGVCTVDFTVIDGGAK